MTKNIKLNILADFIHYDYCGLIIMKNKITSVGVEDDGL